MRFGPHPTKQGNRAMALNRNVEKLIALSAPLWAGEAEVVRTYWDSPVRSLATDLIWLRRQASKEFNGSGIGEHRNMGVFMGPLTRLFEAFPKIDSGVSRHEVLGVIEMLHDEFSHYCAFADTHDAIRDEATPPLDPHKIETWEADQDLTRLRHAHNAEHGALGVRASKFTEGGYCTLFREGMRLAGRGGADELIAQACAKIYEDEFQHMLGGILGLDREGWSDADFATMGELVVAQLRQRILMRNAEFGFPLSEARIEAIYGGEIEPEPFDYEKAERILA
jgi:hypothetical protein